MIAEGFNLPVWFLHSKSGLLRDRFLLSCFTFFILFPEFSFCFFFVSRDDDGADSVNIIVNSSVSMQGAESLLVDKSTGDILASRESELIATSLKDTSNGFLKNVADKINKDDESVTTIRDKVVVTREIAGTDWVLVSYVPTSLITSEVDNLRTILIGVAIVGLLVFKNIFIDCCGCIIDVCFVYC